MQLMFTLLLYILDLLAKGSSSIVACGLLYDIEALVDLSMSNFPSKSTNTAPGFSLLKSEAPEDQDSSYWAEHKSSEKSFRIIMDDRSSFTFSCTCTLLQIAWIDIISVAIMSSKRRTEYFRANEEIECMGNEKEHSIIRTTLFSAATTGDEQMLERVS